MRWVFYSILIFVGKCGVSVVLMLENLQGAHHVTVAGDDSLQRGEYLYISSERLLMDRLIDIDLETFNTMWELSASDGDAPGCFMRLPQWEYHREETNLDSLKLMPNVIYILSFPLFSFG